MLESARPASRRCSGSSASQPSRRSASSVTAFGADREAQQAGQIGSDRLGEQLRDLPHPRVVRRHRRDAAGGGLRRDHPERLGPGARHREGVRRRHHVGDLVVLQTTADQHRAGGGAGGVDVALGRVRQEPGEDRERRVVVSLQATAPRRDLAGGVEIAPAESVDQRPQPVLEGPEADEEEPRRGGAGGDALAMDQRPGRRQQVDALADQELADEQHPDVAVPPQPAERPASAGPSRPKESSLSSGSSGASAARSPASLASVTEGLFLRMRAEAVDVDPGRPEPGALGQARIRDRLEQRPRRVGGAGEDPGGRVGPLARVGDEAVGVRADGVGDVRAVHLDARSAGPPGRGSPGP